MKFLADENFEPQFVERLREEGYEVLFLDEYQGGTEDEEVLGFAVTQDAVVITNDQRFWRVDLQARIRIARSYLSEALRPTAYRPYRDRHGGHPNTRSGPEDIFHCDFQEQYPSQKEFVERPWQNKVIP